jgi:transcriptional regulator with XRE-family HTH domain
MKERVHSDLHRQIGAAIRECRNALGLNQEAFAFRFGRRTPQFGKIERGAQDIRLLTLYNLLTALKKATLATPVTSPSARPEGLALLQMFATALGLPPLRLIPPLASNVSVEKAHDKAHDAANEPINRTEIRIMDACSSTSRTAPDLQKTLGYKSRTGNVSRGLRHLLDAGLLAMTMPSRPRSKNQKYRLTPKGKAYLAAHT